MSMRPSWQAEKEMLDERVREEELTYESTLAEVCYPTEDPLRTH